MSSYEKSIEGYFQTEKISNQSVRLSMDTSLLGLSFFMHSRAVCEYNKGGVHVCHAWVGARVPEVSNYLLLLSLPSFSLAITFSAAYVCTAFPLS